MEAALAEGDGPQWHLVGGKLVKTVNCSRLSRVARVRGRGRTARRGGEPPPDIDIRYDRVTLALVTHDAGGITRLDLALARAIDGVTAGVRPGPAGR